MTFRFAVKSFAVSLVLCAAVVAALALAASAAPAGNAAAGKAIFATKCVACHKADGSGGLKLTGNPTPNWKDPKTWADPKRKDLDAYLRDSAAATTLDSTGRYHRLATGSQDDFNAQQALLKYYAEARDE